MRIDYYEDEDYPGQFELWQANCDRSLRGKQGQKELRELREALLALPEKRLLGYVLVSEDGVCAIGAYGQRKGIDLASYDPEDSNHDEVGIEGGMPRLVAWKVVEMNDAHFDRCTPEQRYVGMLKWVEGLLAEKPQ